MQQLQGPAEPPKSCWDCFVKCPGSLTTTGDQNHGYINVQAQTTTCAAATNLSLAPRGAEAGTFTDAGGNVYSNEELNRGKRTGVVSEAAQNVADRASAFGLEWLNNDKVKALAQRLGMKSEEEKEAQRIEDLNTAAQAELAANAEAGAPVDSEEGALSYLQGMGQQQEARGDFDVGGRRYREPPPVPGEEQEKRNWLDKTLDVMELLGQAGGASKGYEFAQINERQAAQRALTEANEFDMAKQQALLDQRTEERNMILDMQAKIARADALAEINETLHQRVLSDPARERYKESIIKESKGNYWMPFAYNEVWVDSQMADWDIAKFQELQQQAMAPVDASLGTGTTLSSPVNTQGFGQLRVN